MYTRKLRMTALLTCMAIVFVMLFSVLFIANEADHDCSGQDCQTCACIHTVENFFRQLENALAGAVVVILAPVILLQFCKGILSAYFCYPTLVSIRVRLNN